MKGNNVTYNFSQNPFKISVKEFTFRKLVDLQPTTLPKTSSFKSFFFKDFYFSLGTPTLRKTFEWLLIFGNSIARMNRNSWIHDTKFSENWPLNFGLQNVTYMAVYFRRPCPDPPLITIFGKLNFNLTQATVILFNLIVISERSYLYGNYKTRDIIFYQRRI